MRRSGMEWNRMPWNGVEWNRMGWSVGIGMEIERNRSIRFVACDEKNEVMTTAACGLDWGQTEIATRMRERE